VSPRCFVRCAVCSLLLIGLPALPAHPRDERGVRTQIRSLRESIDRYRSRLRSTRDRQEQTRNKLAKTRQKELSLLGLLEDYNQRIRRLETQLNRNRKRARQAERAHREVKRKLERVRGNLDRRTRLLYRRLRAIYKQGRLMHGEIVLGATSMSDLLTRLRFYREIINLDRRTIARYRGTRDRLHRLERERRSILKRRRRLRETVEQKLARLKKTRGDRRELLDDVRNQKVLYQRRIRELKQQQDRLKEMVFDLQKSRSRKQLRLQREKDEFGVRKGRLPWPVASREILRPFGSWWEDGVQHENDGIDIAVEPKTPVRPIAPGRVVFARGYRGMGRVVILRHTEHYVSLYGSMVSLKVQPGDSVKRSDVLGTAGQTPGMESPRLYFQLFRGRRILDPTRWLK